MSPCGCRAGMRLIGREEMIEMTGGVTGTEGRIGGALEMSEMGEGVSGMIGMSGGVRGGTRNAAGDMTGRETMTGGGETGTSGTMIGRTRGGDRVSYIY